MKKATIFVEKGKGKKNYSCFMVEDSYGFGLAGAGDTAREAIADLHVAAAEVKAYMEETGGNFPQLCFSYQFDLGSFFNYHDFLSVSGVAKRADINPSLLRQYIMGAKKPTPQRLEHIKEAIRHLSEEIKAPAIVAAPCAS